MSRKFFVATFGCRTNQADSAAIRQDLLDGDMAETSDPQEADVIVVNSCTVTHRADQQVRQLTRKLRRENPAARLILTGCYAQRDGVSLTSLGGVDAVVGNTHKGKLPAILKRLRARPAGQKELAHLYRDDFQKTRSLDRTPALQAGGKTRPYVKIQDGCDAKCRYCVIPSVRGPSRSVSPEKVLQQVRELINAGFREIVLTGIHVGTYGMHLRPRYPLDRLLADILGLPGLGQLRISSIEPMRLSRRIIDLAVENPRLTPHFHICLQSGSDRILRSMRRPYDTRRFAAIVEDIRTRLPDAGIGTDVLVGFPGETAADHRATMDFVGNMPFTYLHVFPYSDREGTESARMSGKVDPETVKRRAAELRNLSDQKNREFRESFLGRSLSLLTLTETDSGARLALTGNYLCARVDGSIPANRLLQGTATGIAGDDLIISVH